jgi:hypothetical protein
MPTDIDAVRYQRSPPQSAYEFKDSFQWGASTRYIELGDDGFVLRQVDEYENGYLTRYDRVHWDDQFGTLADFRYGKKWIEHWGAPNVITRGEFDAKWTNAAVSPPFSTRRATSKDPPPWIVLYESGQWKGQA